jgi:hypothetical protein
MIFEAGFWLALVAATRAIAKIYYRRRDVLYGPYIGATEGSKIGIQGSTQVLVVQGDIVLFNHRG